MKNIYKTAGWVICAFFLFTHCENDGFYFQDEARVRLEAPYIWALGSDSLEYSFITVPETVSTFELPVTIYLMGKVSATDRAVNIVVDEKLTTARAKHYQLPTQVTLPGNENNVTFPVTLNRTPDLQDNGVRLYIKVVESADFRVGVQEQNHLLVKWNDILSRPGNWNDLVEFFGTFSVVKYRFMLNNTGVSEFNTETMSWAQLMNYKIKLRNALNAYNEAHPGDPLKDENGQYVTF